MKIGYRTPNLNKRISANTTGSIKREIKKTINPLYEKKGMGYVNNPKKAIYDKVYQKTTFSIDNYDDFTSVLNSDKCKVKSKKTVKIDDKDYFEYDVIEEKTSTFTLTENNIMKFKVKNEDYLYDKNIYNTKIYEYKFPKFRKISLNMSDNVFIDIFVRINKYPLA